MPRTKAPPWVRWIGEDGVAACDELMERVDELSLGLIGGQRQDEIMAQIIRIRLLVREMRDAYKSLQHPPRIEDLLE